MGEALISDSSLIMGFINQHHRLCSSVQQYCSDMGGTRCFTPCRPVPLLPMDVAAHCLPEPVRCDGPSHMAARTFHPAACITHQPQPADNDAVLETVGRAHHVHSTVCKVGGLCTGCATEPSPISVHISRCEPLCRGRLCCCWWTNGLWRGCGSAEASPSPAEAPPLPWSSIRHLPLLTFELPTYSIGGATLEVAVSDPWLNRSINHWDGATVLNAAY